jgi:hypothetical protein
MVWWGRHSDLRQERRWHFAAAAALGSVGMLALLGAGGSLFWTLLAVTVSGSAIMASLPIFWAIATRHLSVAAAPVGIAFITSMSSLAGVTPAVIGSLKVQTGSLNAAMVAVAAGLLLGMGAMLAGTRGAGGGSAHPPAKANAGGVA